jgi:hypothetical protein
MTKTAEQTAIENAARRLVNGFSSIPADWALRVAEYIDGDECVPLPMWGTLFKVEDSCDERKIRELMRPIGPHGCETIEDLIDFVEEEGLSIDLAPLRALADAADDDSADLEDLQREVSDAWGENGTEDYWLSAAGWENVGDTGIIARKFDGHLLLGINGAGYDFYESHWISLYQALGYKWHQKDNDTTRTVSVPKCPKCETLMTLTDVDHRGAWDDLNYECPECDK